MGLIMSSTDSRLSLPMLGSSDDVDFRGSAVSSRTKSAPNRIK